MLEEVPRSEASQIMRAFSASAVRLLNIFSATNTIIVMSTQQVKVHMKGYETNTTDINLYLCILKSVDITQILQKVPHSRHLLTRERRNIYAIYPFPDFRYQIPDFLFNDLQCKHIMKYNIMSYNSS